MGRLACGPRVNLSGFSILQERGAMQLLIDKTGMYYELVDLGNGKVKLQTTKFPEISHIYKQTFIGDAIRAGFLKEIPKQMNLLTEKPLSSLRPAQAEPNRGLTSSMKAT